MKENILTFEQWEKAVEDDLRANTDLFTNNRRALFHGFINTDWRGKHKVQEHQKIVIGNGARKGDYKKNEGNEKMC
jgi:hypothetical protein